MGESWHTRPGRHVVNFHLQLCPKFIAGDYYQSLSRRWQSCRTLFGTILIVDFSSGPDHGLGLYAAPVATGAKLKGEQEVRQLLSRSFQSLHFVLALSCLYGDLSHGDCEFILISANIRKRLGNSFGFLYMDFI